MLLKSQLVRSSSEKSNTTYFCGELYRRARERERTKGLCSNRMQMSAVEGQVYTYNLISDPPLLFVQWLPFLLEMNGGARLKLKPRPRSDKTYYAIAQLSQQITDRIQLMSKMPRTDFASVRWADRRNSVS